MRDSNHDKPRENTHISRVEIAEKAQLVSQALMNGRMNMNQGCCDFLWLYIYSGFRALNVRLFLFLFLPSGFFSYYFILFYVFLCLYRIYAPACALFAHKWCESLRMQMGPIFDGITGKQLYLNETWEKFTRMKH